jgi:hypothetical protein
LREQSLIITVHLEWEDEAALAALLQ